MTAFRRYVHVLCTKRTFYVGSFINVLLMAVRSHSNGFADITQRAQPDVSWKVSTLETELDASHDTCRYLQYWVPGCQV